MMHLLIKFVYRGSHANLYFCPLMYVCEQFLIYRGLQNDVTFYQICRSLHTNTIEYDHLNNHLIVSDCAIVR